MVGVSFIARLTMEWAAPDMARYGGNVGEGGQADYGLWPFGAFLPPINPAAIEAAESDNQQPAAGSPGPSSSPVPVAVIDASTVTPTPPLVTAQPSPEAAETRPRSAEPSPTPTATQRATAQLAPTQPPLPTLARVPATPTSAVATATPVTNPGDLLPTSAPPAPTSPPSPTRTPIPTSPPQQPTNTVVPTTPVPVSTSAPPTLTPTLGPSPTPSPTLTPTPPTMAFADASITAAEGNRATFEVRLSSSYHLPITVSYSTSNGSATAGADYKAASGMLTFAPGDTSKIISILDLAKDNLNELNETVYLTLSDPTNATIEGPDRAVLTITDGDPPPTVRFAGDRRTVAEGAGLIGVSIELSQRSAIDVAVPYSVGGTAASSDHSLRAGTVIIPAGSTSARLRFSIVNDKIDESDETIRITLGTPTNADLAIPSVYVVTVTDDDTAGVQVVTNTLTTTEGSAITYTVRLTSEPTWPVLVTLLPDNQLSAAPAALIFDASNWATTQVVTATAIDDMVDEVSPHPGRMMHDVSSVDPNYNWDQAREDTLDVVVRIIDNDDAGVLVTATSPLTVSESLAANDHSAPYAVVLKSQPTEPVTVTLWPDTQVSTSAPALFFNKTNWNITQTVTVTAVDDSIDEPTPHTGLITHTVASADPFYTNLPAPQRPANVTVSIIDNDTSGVEVITNTTTITEGGAITYTLRLTSQPTAPVTITTTGALTPTLPAAVTFSTANWNTTQTITISVPDNSIAEVYSSPTFTVAHTLASTDPNYNEGTKPFTVTSVPVTVLDNDIAGVEVITNTTPVTITEGGAITYTLRLTSQPTATVAINLATILTGEITPTLPAAVTFSTANWNTTQTIPISVPDNSIAEVYSSPTFTVAHTLASTDPNYNEGTKPFTATSVPVTVLDNDIAGVEVITNTTTITEGGAITYTLRLTSEPTSPVTVTLLPDVQLTVGPTSTLVFTQASWNITQTVTVTATDDAAIEPPPQTGLITHTVTSTDPLYATLPPAQQPANVTVAITDNDSAAIAVAVASSQITTEDGGTSTFSISLTSQPTAPVTITVASSNPSEGIVSIAAPLTLPLVFDETNWMTPVVVTVTGANDAAYDGQQPYSVIIGPAQSLDPNYAGLAPTQPVIALRNNDNEPAQVSVGDPAPVSEGLSGTTVISFPVTLMRPALVTITVDYATADLTASAGTDYEAATGTITFTPGMTSTVITTTVIGDNLIEADERFSLQLTGATATGDLTGLGDDLAVAVIVNDDSPLSGARFVLTGGPMSLAEDGYYYTGGANGYGYAVITLPCSWPISRSLSIELWSPAIDGGEADDLANAGGAGATTFELYAVDGAGGTGSLTPPPGAPGSFGAILFPATTGNADWVAFPTTVTNPQPCGRYVLRAAATDDDENTWAVRAGYDADANLATPPDIIAPGTADHVTLALLQTVVAPQVVDTATTAWIYVKPGTAELRLRNFDLDKALVGPNIDPAATIRYYSPSDVYDPLGATGGVAGTPSQIGVWSTADSILLPEAGWWRIVVTTGLAGNAYVLEAAGDGVALPLWYDPPS
ncbi:MAG: hypothetical protein HGA45_15825 [Chloroflexales bacterium]|nr:hypothetical protein [Chloroflexales bacterium]